MASIELTLRIANSIGDVCAESWDACANPAFAPGKQARGPAVCAASSYASKSAEHYNPFLSHDFLSALELSDSVRPRTGWQPMHLLAEDAQGALLGAVPCYVKSHSRGEYVFDHGWAEAYERAGGSYYPKIQVSVPFTPATGCRLLVPPGHSTRPFASRSPMRSSTSAAVPTLPRSTSLFRPNRNGSFSAPAAISSAPTSSSTGRMPVTAVSTNSLQRWLHANARSSVASARTHSRRASACIG